MRLPGKIEPGAGAGPRTGHPGCLSPARIVLTSEMLSALVRLFGCVARTRRIAESGSGLAFAPLRVVSEAFEMFLGVVAAAGALATMRLDESFLVADAFSAAAFSSP